MPEITVSLPDPLEAHVREQVASGGFLDASDYIRALIRADRDKGARRRPGDAISETLASGAGEELARAFLNKLRRKTPPSE